MVLYELYTLDGMARSSDFHSEKRRVRGAEVPLETSRVGNEKWVCVPTLWTPQEKFSKTTHPDSDGSESYFHFYLISYLNLHLALSLLWF